MLSSDVVDLEVSAEQRGEVIWGITLRLIRLVRELMLSVIHQALCLLYFCHHHSHALCRVCVGDPQSPTSARILGYW